MVGWRVLNKQIRSSKIAIHCNTICNKTVENPQDHQEGISIQWMYLAAVRERGKPLYYIIIKCSLGYTIK